MNQVFSAIVETFLFVSLYIQVFLIITLIEHRDKLKKSPALKALSPAELPTVSVIVPCFNEQGTVIGTIESLKKLNYPQEKLSIIAVDDGSTDDTWSYLVKYQDDPQIKLYKKENGGKHTAVNLGIERSTSDIVGCLDADSFVHPEALMRMVPLFADPKVMAVAPAVRVRTPRTVLEHIQHAEYNLGIFLRKMYSVLNAIHVTPGPFSMFRRSVFGSIDGMFRSAHNTEDMEIALRLHSHGFTIENAEHAYVYTTPPKNLRALIKQRIRWTTGFLLNVNDYRGMIFSRKHGHVGTFTLPAGIVALIATIFFAFYALSNVITKTINSITQWQLVGWRLGWHWPTINWFFVNTGQVRIVILVLIATAVGFLFFGKRMATGSWKPSRDIIYSMFLYSFVQPIWISISWYRAFTKNTGSWR